VATVIDVFAPIRLALEHVRTGTVSGPPPRRGPRVDRTRLALMIGALMAVGVVGVGLRARWPEPLPSTQMVMPARPRQPTLVTSSQSLVTPPPADESTMRRERTPAVITIVTRPRGPEELGTLAVLNRKALSAYARRQVGPAMRLLAQAARLCERPAVAWHELCALTHVNLGLVLAGGYGQGGLAAKHFRIAEAIRPQRSPAVTRGRRP
jgi:hypothetical protein